MKYYLLCLLAVGLMLGTLTEAAAQPLLKLRNIEPAPGAGYRLQSDANGKPFWIIGISDEINVNMTAIGYVPASFGNTSNLNQVVTDPNGDIWIIDSAGDAVRVGSTNTFTGSWADLNNVPPGFDDNTDDTIDGDSDPINEMQESDEVILSLPLVVNGTIYYTVQSVIEAVIDAGVGVGGGSSTDDQTASEVSVTPSGNLNSTDVQAALLEHQADINALASGAADGVAVSAALNTTTEIATFSVNNPGSDFPLDLSAFAKDSDLPSVVSELINDSGFITSETDDQVASEVSVTAITELPATTNTQNGLQELATNANVLSGVVTDVITLSGVPVSSQNLGGFTGAIVTTNTTIKQAIQDLETALESLDAGILPSQTLGINSALDFDTFHWDWDLTNSFDDEFAFKWDFLNYDGGLYFSAGTPLFVMDDYYSSNLRKMLGYTLANNSVSLGSSSASTILRADRLYYNLTNTDTDNTIDLLQVIDPVTGEQKFREVSSLPSGGGGGTVSVNYGITGDGSAGDPLQVDTTDLVTQYDLAQLSGTPHSYEVFHEEAQVLSNTLNTFVNAIDTTTKVLTAGIYEVLVTGHMRAQSASTDLFIDVTLDGVVRGIPSNGSATHTIWAEMKDTGGDQQVPFSFRVIDTFAVTQAHTFSVGVAPQIDSPVEIGFTTATFKRLDFTTGGGSSGGGAADGTIVSGSVTGTDLTINSTIGAPVVITGLPSGGSVDVENRHLVAMNVGQSNQTGNSAGDRPGYTWTETFTHPNIRSFNQTTRVIETADPNLMNVSSGITVGNSMSWAFGKRFHFENPNDTITLITEAIGARSSDCWLTGGQCRDSVFQVLDDLPADLPLIGLVNIMQGEGDNGTGTVWLDNWSSFYDDLITHPKVSEDVIFIFGGFAYNQDAVPHAQFDSLLYGLRNTGERPFFAADFKADKAYHTVDGLHYTNQFFNTIGDAFYDRFVSRGYKRELYTSRKAGFDGTGANLQLGPGNNTAQRNTGRNLSVSGGDRRGRDNSGDDVSIGPGTQNLIANEGDEASSSSGYRAMEENKGDRATNTGGAWSGFRQAGDDWLGGGVDNSEYNTGEDHISFGNRSSSYNNWDKVTVIGHNSNDFILDPSTAITLPQSAREADTLTVASTASFGSVGDYINLNMTSVGDLSPSGSVYQFRVSSSTTIHTVFNSLSGSATADLITLTNSVDVSGSVIMADNENADKPDQYVLGGSGIEELKIGNRRFKTDDNLNSTDNGAIFAYNDALGDFRPTGYTNPYGGENSIFGTLDGIFTGSTTNNAVMFDGTRLTDFPLMNEDSKSKFTQATAITLPAGTTGLRPFIVDPGDLRVNTTTDKFEGSVDGTNWVNLATEDYIDTQVASTDFSQNTDVAIFPTQFITHFTLETTSGGASDTNLSLPTASATYAGKTVVIWSIDTNGTFDNTVSATTIQNGVSTGSSITLNNFQSTSVTCIQVTSAGAYRWVVTNQY